MGAEMRPLRHDCASSYAWWRKGDFKQSVIALPLSASFDEAGGACMYIEPEAMAVGRVIHGSDYFYLLLRLRDGNERETRVDMCHFRSQRCRL